jgi:hypothetical protein
MRKERVLLLLDGVEPLQESGGAMRDAALKALLQELATGHLGLVVLTTRVRMDIPEATALDLDNLTPEQGAEYLRSLKVEGADDELQQASREYWNHALALTLLGTYLVDFCGADIRRRNEIPRLMGESEHARGVIAAYGRTFAGKPEADILRALGYFDRPAEPAALRLVLPAMEQVPRRPKVPQRRTTHPDQGPRATDRLSSVGPRALRVGSDSRGPRAVI